MVFLRLILILLIIILVVVNLTAGIQSLSKPYVFMKDFFQDYAMSWATINGLNPYTPIPELKQRMLNITNDQTNPHPTTHPPAIALLFLPLTLLPIENAAVLWFVLEICFTLFGIFILYKYYWKHFGWLEMLITALFMMIWYPFREEIILGQLMSLILLLLIAGWLSLRNERDVQGGIFIGAIIALKLILWPMIIFLALRRRWHAVGSAIITVIIANIAASLLIGFNRIIDYYLSTGPMVSTFYRTVDRNRSLWTIGWRLFYGTGRDYFSNIQSPPLFYSPDLASILSFILPASLLLLVLWSAIKSTNFDMSFSLLVVVSILISPIAWDFYFLLLLIPFAVIIRSLFTLGLPRRETYIASVVFLVLLSYDPLLTIMFSLFPQTAEVRIVPLGASLLTLLPTFGILMVIALIRHLGMTRPNILPMNRSN